MSLKGHVSHIQHMILPGERLQVFAHHFMMGTGVFKGLIKLGDLSQVSQQVRDKGRNTIKTFLGPRPNASGHDVKIRICQLSFTAHFPGISRDAPSLPSPQVASIAQKWETNCLGLMVKEKVPTPLCDCSQKLLTELLESNVILC